MYIESKLTKRVVLRPLNTKGVQGHVTTINIMPLQANYIDSEDLKTIESIKLFKKFIDDGSFLLRKDTKQEVNKAKKVATREVTPEQQALDRQAAEKKKAKDKA